MFNDFMRDAFDSPIDLGARQQNSHFFSFAASLDGSLKERWNVIRGVWINKIINSTVWLTCRYEDTQSGRAIKANKKIKRVELARC
jgi:hypothetical protein